MAQFYPGTSKIAQNRRNFMNPDHELEKLREISDEGVVNILGHRAPGEEYPSVHPPLEEMDEPEDAIREMVEPLDGAKAGDRVRYIQFSDSMYNAPCHPFIRSRAYLWRFRGADAGTLSGRQIIETRERDLEKVAKELLEQEWFDPARSSTKGKTVHGHAVRLDQDGMMFDMLRRQVLNKDTGHVEAVKNQIGDELDEPVDLGEPLDEATLAAKTTIYRKDNSAYRDDKESVEVLQRIHVLRSQGGFYPE
jgi:methyl-coenzyme M reductase gamma subunit